MSGETQDAERMLRSAPACYSAAEPGVEALHPMEDVLDHPFPLFLHRIRESAAMRRRTGDSETPTVPIVGSGKSGGAQHD